MISRDKDSNSYTADINHTSWEGEKLLPEESAKYN